MSWMNNVLSVTVMPSELLYGGSSFNVFSHPCCYGILSKSIASQLLRDANSDFVLSLSSPGDASTLRYISWRSSDIIPVEYRLRHDAFYKEVATARENRCRQFGDDEENDVALKIMNSIDEIDQDITNSPLLILDKSFFATLDFEAGDIMEIKTVSFDEEEQKIIQSEFSACSQRDFDLLEDNMHHVETTLLQQLRVISLGQRISIYLEQAHSYIQLVVVSIVYQKPATEYQFGFLRVDTEIHVQSTSGGFNKIFRTLESKQKYVKRFRVIRWEATVEASSCPLFALNHHDFFELRLCSSATRCSFDRTGFDPRMIMNEADGKCRVRMWAGDYPNTRHDHHQLIIEIIEDVNVAAGTIGVPESISLVMSWNIEQLIVVSSITTEPVAIDCIHITPMIYDETQISPTVIRNSILKHFTKPINENKEIPILISDGQVASIDNDKEIDIIANNENDTGIYTRNITEESTASGSIDQQHPQDNSIKYEFLKRTQKIEIPSIMRKKGEIEVKKVGKSRNQLLILFTFDNPPDTTNEDIIRMIASQKNKQKGRNCEPEYVNIPTSAMEYLISHINDCLIIHPFLQLGNQPHRKEKNIFSTKQRDSRNYELISN